MKIAEYVFTLILALLVFWRFVLVFYVPKSLLIGNGKITSLGMSTIERPRIKGVSIWIMIASAIFCVVALLQRFNYYSSDIFGVESLNLIKEHFRGSFDTQDFFRNSTPYWLFLQILIFFLAFLSRNREILKVSLVVIFFNLATSFSVILTESIYYIELGYVLWQTSLFMLGLGIYTMLNKNQFFVFREIKSYFNTISLGILVWSFFLMFYAVADDLHPKREPLEFEYVSYEQLMQKSSPNITAQEIAEQLFIHAGELNRDWFEKRVFEILFEKHKEAIKEHVNKYGDLPSEYPSELDYQKAISILVRAYIVDNYEGVRYVHSDDLWRKVQKEYKYQRRQEEYEEKNPPQIYKPYIAPPSRKS